MIRWMFGWDDVSAIAHDGRDDGREESPSPEPDLDKPIAEDWCVVTSTTRDRVRTIDIADVHVQRVRNRPQLANWEATEDLLIENPLVLAGAQPPKKSYATAAAPSYAQALMMRMHPRGPVVQPCGDDAPAMWTPVTGPDAVEFQTKRANAHGIDWMDVDACRASRVGRRYMSRVYVHRERRGCCS